MRRYLGLVRIAPAQETFDADMIKQYVTPGTFQKAQPNNPTVDYPVSVVFDGRYIQDRYHGIGRYAFQLLLEIARLLPERRFVVLRDPSLTESRFDWSALEALPNIRVRLVAAHPFSAREQIVLPFLTGLKGRAIYYSPYFALPWLLRAPSLVTVHDCIFEHDVRYMPRPWTRTYYKLLMAYSMRRARIVFVPSKATARDVRRFYHVPSRKLIVTPEAADASFQPIENSDTIIRVREHYGLPDQFVLAVGARRPHKNFGMLVRAIERLEKTELVFVGNADDRFADEVAQEAASLNGRVRFLGSVPEADLPALYNLATLLACPSLIEGFGLPLLEAMSCGAPVVCSDIPVFREVAGSAAIYVDPLDEADWGQALSNVLSSQTLQSELRDAGLKRAAQFTWERTARSLLPLYVKLFPRAK